MIELNTTGYMHNRSRLITSNFLNRMLGYHWKVGEKYYATQLTDYDPSVNNGNWQDCFNRCRSETLFSKII